MADFTVPTSLKAKDADGVTGAAAVQGKIVPLQCAMLEFDFDESLVAVDSYLELIPASLNANGIIIKSIKGFVTEIFNGGGTFVITINDEDDNTLATLTPAAADDVGELVAYGASGFTAEWEALADNSDYSGHMVTEDLCVDAAITTATAATTGRLLVLVEFYAVPSKN